MEVIEQQIFSYLRRQQAPVGIKRLLTVLKLPRREQAYLRSVLKDMVRSGRVVRMSDGRYWVPDRHRRVDGATRSDAVRGFRIGTVHTGRRGLMLRPVGSRKQLKLTWPEGMAGKPQEGDRVAAVQIGDLLVAVGTETPARKRMWGRLRGHWFEPVFRQRRVQLRGIRGKGEVAELLLERQPRVLFRYSGGMEGATGIPTYRHNLFGPWPSSRPVPETPEEDLSRLDLRDRLLFTIDGAEAKDFDDALSLERVPGGYELGVHIADVSAYVTPGSALDRQALLRGVSVYMPGRVFPMLPEVLSNDRCSLRPGEDRLALSVLFQLDRRFHVEQVTVTPSTIRSRHRLRYDQVSEYLEAGRHQHEGWARDCGAVLERLASFARHRRQLRRARGALFLQIPRPMLTLSEGGHVTRIAGAVSGLAEEIVEECMLLANETIAELLVEHGIGAIFRVHPGPGPEAWETLQTLATELGLSLCASSVTDLLHQAGDPRIHAIALRLLGRARYESTPGLHFGLATNRYLHFTSPIRRYPDLVVHRMVKAWLARTPVPHGAPELAALAAVASFRESRAFYAELDTVDMLILDRLQRDGRTTCPGTVSGMTDRGLFVELDDYYVDGFLPISAFSRSYRRSPGGFVLMDRDGRSVLSVGSRLTVRIRKIDPLLRRLELSPVDRRL